MDAIMKEFGTVSPADGRDGYRLLNNPFFIKICPRIVLKPDEADLTPGMYFSLDHWKVLEADPELVGPRGGRRISYANAGRYLNNGDFAALVKNAWVGTAPGQSAMLEPMIAACLSEGRAVVIAVKSETEPPVDDEDDF